MKRQLPIVLFLFLLTLVGWDSFAQTQIFSTPTPEVQTFTIPAGVTSITVEVWGAGGRGGGKVKDNGEAAGGGGGAYSRSVITVTPGQIINYYVGFGGTTESPGEDSWFLSNTSVMAKGGNSVADNSTIGVAGGDGGSGFGDFKLSGGKGADATDGNGGGGGSSAGINLIGVDATNQTGATAPEGGGNGGRGKTGGQGSGENGFSPGGGGGGAKRSSSSGTERLGGNGGAGQIRISYISLTSEEGTDDQFICEDNPITEITYSFPAGSTITIENLPDGLTSVPNTTAGTLTISGIPTASGTYTINTIPSYLSSIPVILSRSGSVTVIPRPDVTDMTETTCSGEPFRVTPVDGINGFIPDVTTYSWDAPIVTGGLTGGASGTDSDDITGNLTNPTNTTQTATYTVTPTHNGCDGDPFEVVVTINPIATIDDQTVEVCTGDTFDITPVNVTDGIVPAGTTYTWESPSMTGGLTGGTAGSGSAISGTLTNLTNTQQTATYTVTPTSGTCIGPNFTVNVTVDPGPNIDDLTTSVCSEETFTVTPANETDGIVPSGTTYTWGTPSVTGGLTGGAAGSGSSITGTLTNTTNTTQTATYTVTPSAGGCIDDTFLVTVTVDPKPDVTDITETVCSDDSFTITPIVGLIPAGTTYSWEPPVVTGGLTGGASGADSEDIIGNLTNPTNFPQTATYTVTPTSGDCTGPDFTVTVTVDPIASIGNQTLEVCTGDSFTIIPANGTDGIVPAGTTYSWGAPNVTGGLTGGTSGGGTEIIGTLENPTNTQQTATYTVTPTSNGCDGPNFTVTITIDPEPNISDISTSI